MTLHTSGAISTAHVAAELGIATNPVSLNHTNVRTLAKSHQVRHQRIGLRYRLWVDTLLIEYLPSTKLVLTKLL